MSNVRFIGLDVHAETIAVAVAEPDGEAIGTVPVLRMPVINGEVWSGPARKDLTHLGFDTSILIGNGCLGDTIPCEERIASLLKASPKGEGFHPSQIETVSRSHQRDGDPSRG